MAALLHGAKYYDPHSGIHPRGTWMGSGDSVVPNQVDPTNVPFRKEPRPQDWIFFPRTPSRPPRREYPILRTRFFSKRHISRIDLVRDHRVARTHPGSSRMYSRVRIIVFRAMK